MITDEEYAEVNTGTKCVVCGGRPAPLRIICANVECEKTYSDAYREALGNKRKAVEAVLLRRPEHKRRSRKTAGTITFTLDDRVRLARIELWCRRIHRRMRNMDTP